VAEFFDAATDETWRTRARRAAGLQQAGAVVMAFSNPTLYAERYAESDKASSGLGAIEAWPVPYWHGDAAMATMSLLLLIEEAGWSACFWGAFRGADTLRELVGLNEQWQLFGSILIGHAGDDDPRSASLTRTVPPRADRIVTL
jgi:nitroreductase